MSSTSFTLGEKTITVRMDSPSANGSLEVLSNLWDTNASETVGYCLQLQALENQLDEFTNASEALELLVEHWDVTKGKAIREALRYSAMQYKVEADQ